ncbi:MAG TPA: hypothetical protein VD997_11980 [Phycisphaerales bacterium]|nr:hypothetical protein [Phycisphaerales bacterium]
MPTKDKIKAAVAVVILLIAGVVIYLNLRDPKPSDPAAQAGAPPAAPAAPDTAPKTAGANAPAAPTPEPTPGNRRIYKGR